MVPCPSTRESRAINLCFFSVNSWIFSFPFWNRSLRNLKSKSPWATMRNTCVLVDGGISTIYFCWGELTHSHECGRCNIQPTQQIMKFGMVGDRKLLATHGVLFRSHRFEAMRPLLQLCKVWLDLQLWLLPSGGQQLSTQPQSVQSGFNHVSQSNRIDVVVYRAYIPKQFMDDFQSKPLAATWMLITVPKVNWWPLSKCWSYFPRKPMDVCQWVAIMSPKKTNGC